MSRATISIPAINFFRQHRRRLVSLQKQDKLIFWIVLGVFVVVGAVTTGLVVYAFTQSRQSEQLQQKDEQATRTLKGMVEQEAQYLVYSARLKSLSDVWSQRGSQQKTLAFLTQLTLSGVEFQTVTFEQGTRTLQFTVSTGDYFMFEEFINHLRQPEIIQQITSFSMKNVSRTDEGKYRMEVSLQLKAAS
jgi:Tfp pilus assembly protein PilN